MFLKSSKGTQADDSTCRIDSNRGKTNCDLTPAITDETIGEVLPVTKLKNRDSKRCPKRSMQSSKTESSDRWTPSIYQTRSKSSLSQGFWRRTIVGLIAILNPLPGRLRKSRSIDQTKVYYRIEKYGNAILARYKHLDPLFEGSCIEHSS